MKEVYVAPEVEVIELDESSDTIATSGPLTTTGKYDAESNGDKGW